MVNKLAFEAIDRTLKDFTENEEPFGGIVFVMSSDFHQVLPVVQKGTRVEIISSSNKGIYPLELFADSLFANKHAGCRTPCCA
jgi:hypothetical protein